MRTLSIAALQTAPVFRDPAATLELLRERVLGAMAVVPHAQLLLLPVAWYLAVGSGQWIYGIGLAVVALVTLVQLFSPSAVQWLSTQDSDGAASADSSGPDTR